MINLLDEISIKLLQFRIGLIFISLAFEEWINLITLPYDEDCKATFDDLLSYSYWANNPLDEEWLLQQLYDLSNDT